MLEVEKHQFTFDCDSKLGAGVFGQVCMGRLQLNGRDIVVAVKRVNPDCAREDNLTNLRSLLAEIKVLSYLGTHVNVVSLLGAHTGNLGKGELYAFLELCSRGSLQKYLKTLRKGDTCDLYLDIGDPLGGLDKEYDINPLPKWSLDIACGMEFLASKQVVHADIAIRNVLLDTTRKAKICDFGLSRRMMNYQSYVKTHQEPLPWRWMAPESLRRNEFNEMTDVWAFGVTLWEIYTLGDVPYPEMSWNVNFSASLENGLRLPSPKPIETNLTGGINLYPIMELCWKTNPKERPQFRQVKEMLTKEYQASVAEEVRSR